jgi:3-oxoacyl-[acyl-carrier protein] reductase
LHGLPTYDVEQGYPDSEIGLTRKLAASLISEGLSAIALPDIDFSGPTAATRLFEAVQGFGGQLDGLVLNHAYSASATLGSWTADTSIVTSR